MRSKYLFAEFPTNEESNLDKMRTPEVKLLLYYICLLAFGKITQTHPMLQDSDVIFKIVQLSAEDKISLITNDVMFLCVFIFNQRDKLHLLWVDR